MGMVTETTSRKRIFSMQQHERSTTWSSPFSTFTPFNLANESKTTEPFQKRQRTLHKPDRTTFKWEPEPELSGKLQMASGNFFKDMAVRTPLPATWQSRQLLGSSLRFTSPAVKASGEQYELVKQGMIERDLWHSKLDYSTGLAEDALDRVGRPVIGLKLTLGTNESYYERFVNARRELEDFKQVVHAVNSYVPLTANGRSMLSPSLESIKRRGSNLQQGPRNLYDLQADKEVVQNGGSWSLLSNGWQDGETFSDPVQKEDLIDDGRSSHLDSMLKAGLEPLKGQDATASAKFDDDENRTEDWRTLYERIRDPKRIAEMESREKDIEVLHLKLEQLKVTREEDGVRREEERRAKKKDEVPEAFTPLSKEAEDSVDDALDHGNRYEVLVMHDETNIEVTRAIIQCLQPGAWLNDEVINVYMQLLKERELREPEKYLKCHFFNTFFYNKLFKDKQSYDYKSVRRWTTQKKIGYSLADCDKILVPIHQDVHWCLAVINIREQRFEYLDSLKGQDRYVLQVLAKYIVDEAKDKSNRGLDVSKWELAFPNEIPDQLNGCDCGMFMVKYADFHSRGVPLSFTQEHMEYFRRRTVYEILQLEAT